MDKDGFEISFRLSLAKGAVMAETHKEVIKNEIISWMEDTFRNHKVEDLQVKEREGMFGFFVGDSEEWIVGTECPRCNEGTLDADTIDFENGEIYCNADCGFTIHSKNRGWVITDITIEECEHTTTDMGGKCTHCLHQL